MTARRIFRIVSRSELLFFAWSDVGSEAFQSRLFTFVLSEDGLDGEVLFWADRGATTTAISDKAPTANIIFVTTIVSFICGCITR